MKKLRCDNYMLYMYLIILNVYFIIIIPCFIDDKFLFGLNLFYLKIIYNIDIHLL